MSLIKFNYQESIKLTKAKAGILLVLFLVVVNLVFPQLALATLYQPGATLEPDCAPGSANCGVAPAGSLNLGNSDLTLSSTRSLFLNSNSLTFVGAAGNVVFDANGGVAVGGNFSTPQGSDYPTTGSQNDVNLGIGYLFRYTGSNAAIFTGIAGGAAGRQIRIINASSFNLTLNNQDTNSAAADRIITANGHNATINSNGTVSLQYDGTAGRWRITALPLEESALVQGGNALGTAVALGTTDANALNLVTGGATRLSLAASSATLTGTGATSITTDNTLSLSSAAGSALTVTAGTSGALSLDSGTTGAINIGTGSNPKTITVGNTTSTTALILNSGSGGIALGGNTTISGANTLTTGTGLTTINSTAITLAGDSTILDMTGAGTLSINTTNNRPVTIGSGLLTVGGAATVNGLATFNGNLTANGDVTLGNAISDRIVFNGVVPGAQPIVFDGTTGDSNYLTLAVADPTTSTVATIPVLSANDTFVFQSQSATLANKTLTSPVLNGNLSGTGISTDATLAANSDTLLASQKAIKTYVDTKASGISYRPPVNLIDFSETNPGANVVGHATSSIDGIALTNGMRVIYGNNSVPALYNDKIFLVGGVGASITLTLQTDGQAGNGDPTQGDTVFVLSGTTNANKTFVWTASSHHWEQSNSLNGSLVATNNLSDVSNAATAKTNLGLGATSTPTFGGLTISSGNISQSGTGTLTTGSGLLTASGNATIVGLLTGQAGAVIAGANITLNHDSNFNIELGTGSSTGTISIGGGLSPVVVNSTSWGISTLGAATGFTSLSSAAATNLNIDSGTTGDLNFGTSTNAKIITIGNVTGATTLNLNSGSGGINLNGATVISGANTLTTGTGLTTINSTAVTLTGNSTVLDMTGSGNLNLNTTTNRPITTGSGLLTVGGNLTVTATSSLAGNFITPKGADYTTTGSQNDVNLGAGSLIRYTGNGAAIFTGLTGGADGRQLRIMNASAFNLSLTNDDASSTAANRIFTAASSTLVVPTNVSVGLQYDAGVSRWRVVVLPATSATISGFAYIQGGNAFAAPATLGTTDANALNLITSGSTRLTVATSSATLIGTGATTITTNNTLALLSAAGSALTVTASTTGVLTLDSGTTGAVNLGTGNNSKTINIGTGTAGDAINIGTDNTTADTISIGSALDALSLTSNGFNVTTGGALTGVASLDTIAASATGLTFVATGTISSTGGNSLTLDSGTTGAVNIGTGANNAKIITIGNGTSTTALNLQSGSGNINFQVSGTSTTGNVQIGAGGGGSASPDLLALDVKNTSGDPTGTNGAMYYNSNTNKFRCYENSAWKNCDTTILRTATLNDTTSDTLATSEAELLDGIAPAITPNATTSRLWITGTIRVVPAAADNENDTFRIRRGSGNCSGTQVGGDLVVATTVATFPTSFISFNFIDSPATTTSQAYTVCGLSDVATTPNTTPVIMITVTEIGAAGADIAELYSTTDSTLEPGDVVSIDANTAKGVRKSTSPSDRLALGIVSTYPGLLFGGDVQGDHVVQVALAGRVPVKVVTENGPIQAGDYLGPSSVSGVAMKANGLGPVIGQAMSDYSSQGVGVITAFVKNFDLSGGAVLLGDISPKIKADGTDNGLATLVASIQTETPPDPISLIGKKISDGVQFLTDFVAARITAIRGYFDEIFANKIHTKQICVQKSDGAEVCVNGDQLNSILPNINPTPVSAPAVNNNSNSTNENSPTSANIQVNPSDSTSTEVLPTSTDPISTEATSDVAAVQSTDPDLASPVVTAPELSPEPAGQTSTSQ